MRRAPGGRWHHAVSAEHYSLDQLRRDHAARGINAPGGYHWMIHRAFPGGPWIISPVRPEERIGAHDAGENDCVGVVVADNLVTGQLEQDAEDLLVILSADIARRHGFPAEAWRGHGGADDPHDHTLCPGLSGPELDRLRSRVAARLAA